MADFCVGAGEVNGETCSEMLIDWQRAKRLAREQLQAER